MNINPAITPRAIAGPIIHVTSPESGATVHPSVVVTGVVEYAQGGLASVEVNNVNATINGAAFTATVSGLTDGLLTLAVTATDNSGNTANLSFSVAVNKNAPIWTDSGLRGAAAKSVVIDPSNPQTLYLSVSGVGVLKSIDAGENWFQVLGLKDSIDIGSISGSPLTIDHNNPSILYFGSGPVFKTIDAGETWSKLPGIIPAQVEIDPFDSNHLLLIGAKGLFRSTDGGQSLTAVNGLPIQISCVKFDPLHRGIVYVGNDRLFQSLDGDATWTDITSRIGSTQVTDIIQVAINPFGGLTYVGVAGGLHQSADAGSTWSLVSNAGGIPVKFDPNQANIFYSVAGEAFKTVDGGQSYTAIDSGLTSNSTLGSGLAPPANVNVSSIEIDSTNPQILYTTTTTGVFKSTDAGANWLPIDNGLNKLDIASMATSKVDASLILAGTSTGEIFKSSNSGNDWVRIDPDNASFGPILSLATDPQNRDVIYAGTNYAIFKSSDGGLTWNEVIMGVRGANALEVDPLNPNGILSGSIWGDIYFNQSVPSEAITVFSVPIRNDPLTPQVYPQPVNTVVFKPQNPNIIYAGTLNGIFESKDHGYTWFQAFDAVNTASTGLNSDVTSIAIEPLNPQNMYITTLGGTFRSVDGGVTWLGTDPFDPLTTGSFAVIDPDMTSTVYEVSDSFFNISHDRGVTWTEIAREPNILPQLFMPVPTSLVALAGSSSSILMGVKTGGVLRLSLENPPAPIVTGDINRDGRIDVTDLTILANAIAGNVMLDNPAADVNHDGHIDIQDLIILANFIAGNRTSLP